MPFLAEFSVIVEQAEAECEDPGFELQPTESGGRGRCGEVIPNQGTVAWHVERLIWKIKQDDYYITIKYFYFSMTHSELASLGADVDQTGLLGTVCLLEEFRKQLEDLELRRLFVFPGRIVRLLIEYMVFSIHYLSVVSVWLSC